MKNTIKTPLFTRFLRVSPVVFMLATVVSGCGGDGPESNSPTPTVPPEYPVESIELIPGLRALYEFEGSVRDTSGNNGDAVVVGHSTEIRDLGNISFDALDGIHALSEAAVFNAVSGLVLPPNVIYQYDYSVSMWVKPERGSDATGTIFFAESNGNTLTLDHTGVTVAGATGFGRNGDETLTYTSENFVLESGKWQHLAFTVEEGNVDIYINGRRVYKSGDILANGLVFGSGEESWALRTESFNDFFSGGDNTLAIGVTNSEENTNFNGKIDSLRIYDSALYYGNIVTLSQEIIDEGPAASLSADYTFPDTQLAWTLTRFTPQSINILRSRFVEPGAVEPDGAPPVELALPNDGSALDGSDVSFIDTDVPIGQNYQYEFRFVDADGHIFESSLPSYLRIPGEEPYAAVTATRNTDTNNIDLSFYTENISVSSYEILRDTDPDIADANSIASNIVENDFIDERNSETFPLKNGTDYYYWIRVTDTEGNVTTSLTLPTASATAAGDLVPLSTIIIEENTNGFCGVDGYIESNHPGWEGEGFVNTDNAEGEAVRWRVNVQEAGTYNIYVRYANGAGDNRWGILDGDGVPLVDEVNLPPTGGWGVWVNAKYVAVLPEGEISLTLTAQTSGGLSNIDSLRLEAVDSENAPTGVPCAEQ